MGRQRKKDRHLPPRMQRKGRVYYYTPYLDGRVVWIRLSENLSDALREWAKREGAARSKGTTVGEAMDKYIITKLPDLAAATQREYLRYSTILRPIFGEVHLEDVERSDIVDYLERSKAKILANREISMLSAVFKAAISWDWCKSNPCHGVERNKEKARDKLPEESEIDAILTAAPPNIRLIIKLALLTSARKQDLLLIKLSDIGDEGLTIVVRKSERADSNRAVRRLLFEWTDDLRTVIDAARQLPRRIDSPYLFTTRRGKPYTTSGFDSIWQRVLSRAGVSGLHFHDLRARALTDAKNQGGMDYAVELAAHESASTTERYLRDRQAKRVRPVKRKF